MAETQETVSQEERKNERQTQEKRKQGQTNEERSLGKLLGSFSSSKTFTN